MERGLSVRAAHSLAVPDTACGRFSCSRLLAEDGRRSGVSTAGGPAGREGGGEVQHEAGTPCGRQEYTSFLVPWTSVSPDYQDILAYSRRHLRSVYNGLDHAFPKQMFLPPALAFWTYLDDTIGNP